MALAFGNKIISKAYFGGKTVSAIYLGTKKVFPDEEEAPAEGDIRLRIETTNANQLFQLFYEITTKSGGYVSVDWGDGNKETLTGKTLYYPEHTYATAGEYTVKLTGSKFTGVNGCYRPSEDDAWAEIFAAAVREILSLKMPTDSTNVSLNGAFEDCANLVGHIPEWDDCITTAVGTYRNCTGLTGSIPKWGTNIVRTISTYYGCTGLTGSIPAWGAKLTDVSHTYYKCTGLTGNIPEWGANIWNAYATYGYCSGLTGNIPAWGANITNTSYTYLDCSGLTGCSDELLQDPMPSRITSHAYCVTGCVDAIRQHFTPDWGGIKEEYLPGTGDIRLRIETTSANQTFPLFYQITTEEGGYVSVDWGDGNTETLTGKTTYQPEHTYATRGEYIVKLTGSKFTEVGQYGSNPPIAFRDAIREILSLKMPTDSMSVSLDWAFRECDKLVGSIPEWGANITSARLTYQFCSGLTGNIPAWGANITNADYTYAGCSGLTGSIPAWGLNITDAKFTYQNCTGLTGSIPKWGVNIITAHYTYYNCTGLTGSIPEWGANITEALYTYSYCTSLTGSIPAWGANIWIAEGTYAGCSGLTGSIPAWGLNITDTKFTYEGCSGLTECSAELLQDPMPSRITDHDNCVYGCVDAIRQHFTPDWGGTKPAEGDIRLRIQTTNANQSFPLFHEIETEEGGYVTVDWGDGNTETLTGKTTYRPTHTYATAGEYTVKLTGSKFTGVNGDYHTVGDFKNAVRKILSLKMPADSTSVSLDWTFYSCDNLTGNIPAWDDCITSAYGTYEDCTGLTGNIPAWGAKIWFAEDTYRGCVGLTGNIPEWGAKITNADFTYGYCSGLTGNIPAWSANITKANYTYSGCVGLTGNIPEWGAKITNAERTYEGCAGLTGRIPEWGASLTDVAGAYSGCSGLTGCSKELLQDPMPSRITSHSYCVYGCVNAIKRHFNADWIGLQTGA